LDSYVANVVYHCYSRKSGNPKKQKEYTGRVASSEQQQSAITRAEELQKNLNSEHPLFVKSLTRSNVSSCFWLVSYLTTKIGGLTNKFY